MYKRRYFKRPISNKKKYSFEQTSFNLLIPSYTQATVNELTSQVSIPLIPPSDLYGMRKIKNITISFASNNTQTYGQQFYYSIVYVPQGYDVQSLTTPSEDSTAISMYSANQFVMSCGLIELSAGPIRINSRLARNLNSGDSIALICKQVAFDTAAAIPINALATYAVCYS